MTSPQIEVIDLYKSFPGKTIMSGLSLSIQKGEKIAIIGPSGSGKSTLLRLVMGLQKPNHGTILVEGHNIHRLRPKAVQQLRMKFGMLFQSAALFDSMTVGDNVAFTLREIFRLPESEIKKQVAEKLELVEMSGSENAMPSDLSGGQKKRIGLARALAANPEIMLYDEPTTGLDPILSTNIEDLIVKLNNHLHVTSIVVTHQISTILRTADKIYLVHEGKLFPPETPDSIMDSPNEIVRRFIRGGL
ncbi:MAG: ABC transporter ATP-binding protein [Candidatus Margulisiibacteriota bacterium]